MEPRALTAEFIGTFALIFVGAGAAAIGAGGLLGVAFAHGFVVVGFAYAYGHVSGTHINPAVTLGLLLVKEIEPATAIGYWIVQLLGGVAGAAALAAVLGGTETGLGTTLLGPGVTPLQGLAVEMILTFFLVNAVLQCAVSGKVGQFAGIGIGLTLTGCILMGGPLTGASLNPARTLGPALMTGRFDALWIYFVGPLGGAAIAAMLYDRLLGPID